MKFKGEDIYNLPEGTVVRIKNGYPTLRYGDPKNGYVETRHFRLLGYLGYNRFAVLLDDNYEKIWTRDGVVTPGEDELEIDLTYYRILKIKKLKTYTNLKNE